MKAVLACAGALAITLAVGPAVGQQNKTPPKASQQLKAERIEAPPVQVDADAFQALQRMSTYLASLPSFEVRCETTVDLIMVNDQKVKLDGVTNYKVRRPNGMIVENITDRKDRRFFYDGKKFTVYAPKKGFYSTVEAPGTIRELLDVVYDDFGISLPLQDLFYWAEPNVTAANFVQAFRVGDASVGGVPADHYAFSEGEVDWQIWIAKGDKPLPLRIVITDPTDPVWPEYSARMSWNTAPNFTDATFAFVPPEGASAIKMASAKAGD